MSLEICTKAQHLENISSICGFEKNSCSKKLFRDDHFNIFFVYFASSTNFFKSSLKAVGDNYPSNLLVSRKMKKKFFLVKVLKVSYRQPNKTNLFLPVHQPGVFQHCNVDIKTVIVY